MLENFATLDNTTTVDPPIVTSPVITDVPAVEITKSVDKSISNVGEFVTYTLNVVNVGPEVTAYLGFVEAGYATINHLTIHVTTSNGVACYDEASYMLTVTLDDLAVGEEVIITFDVVVSEETVRKNLEHFAILDNPTTVDRQ